MDVGKFRTKVEFKNIATTLSETGVPSDTYTTFHTAGAHFTSLKGNPEQQTTSGVANFDEYAQITVRYHADIDSIDFDAIVTIGTTNYHIESINRMNMRGQFLRFIIRRFR